MHSPGNAPHSVMLKNDSKAFVAIFAVDRKSTRLNSSH